MMKKDKEWSRIVMKCFGLEVHQNYIVTDKDMENGTSNATISCGISKEARNTCFCGYIRGVIGSHGVYAGPFVIKGLNQGKKVIQLVRGVGCITQVVLR